MNPACPERGYFSSGSAGSYESLECALLSIVRGTAWLCEVLEAVRDVGPSGAFIAAGAVRDTVWDVLTGRAPTQPHADIDVVYWDNAEEPDACALHERRLRAVQPSFDWEVTNQASIHRWHWQAHGLRIAPHRSVAEGLATWPETATAVGVRYTPEGAFEVLAPFGLDDLFALRLRHNPAQAGPELFWRRVEAKGWLRRWPELELVTPAKVLG